MASSMNDIMNKMLHALAAKVELEVVERNFAKGAIIGVACAGVGLVLGGTNGFVAGAAAGGALGIVLSKSSKPLIDVLKELTPETKEKLFSALWQLLKEVVWLCVYALIETVLGDVKLTNKIVDFLRSFFERSLNMTVKRKA